MHDELQNNVGIAIFFCGLQDSYIVILRQKVEDGHKDMEALKNSEAFILKGIATFDKLIDTNKKRIERVPEKVARLKVVESQLEADLKPLELSAAAQKAELVILESVMSNPCPVLQPRFVPTSTAMVGTEVFVSNCPVCCHGYHCFNWVPASCGHIYHPHCLFTLLGDKTRAPCCFACGKPFLEDWVRSWGLPKIGQDKLPSGEGAYIQEIKATYRVNSACLGRHRHFVQQMQSTQALVCIGTLCHVLVFGFSSRLGHVVNVFICMCRKKPKSRLCDCAMWTTLFLCMNRVLMKMTLLKC